MKKYLLVTSFFLLASCSPQHAQSIEDIRQYTHGISIINNSVIWSEKSDEQRKNGWTHDIYKKEIEQSQIEPLVENPEAQEPASASSTKETIIITYEDGFDTKNSISQRFRIYDYNWQELYEATLFDGGHSGHVASTNTQHVIFWSNRWINGGGIDELGTGKEVIVSTISNEGELLHEIKISQADDRDSWPILAASDDNALLIWQHFNDKATKAALYFAVYNPATNELTQAPAELLSQVDFYMYSVSYVEATKQYVVAAQTNEGGTLILLSKDGEIIDQIDAPDLVREATPAIQENILAFPQMPSGYFTVHVLNNQLQLQPSNILDIEWGTTGTAGIFLDAENMYFGTLNKEGLQEVFVEIDEEEQ
ncbi:hypothetical protein [Planococcus halocryophilus]|uniref:hypothetical protein n=1 Tax=Planococcus halocryophilus TaxID=1215089 RepID=UPI001F0F35FB|nr:hypothetical protein [Planococcus halocryophilus]MCH4825539.1 hypothetical protein [Planococcus halocryophilus]